MAKAVEEFGTRHNSGKPRFTLISPYAMSGLVDVLGHGAKEYGDRNWEKGLPVEEILDSMNRHQNSLMKGELIDKDSGLPHADHILCNAMFLSHFYHRRIDLFQQLIERGANGEDKIVRECDCR